MAVAATPGAALLNQLLFIRFRDRRTSHVMMAGAGWTGDVIGRCGVTSIVSMVYAGIVSYDTPNECTICVEGISSCELK